MLKKLLATTALVAVIASPSFAQTQTPAAPMTTAPQANVAMPATGDALASKLIGQTVYSSDASDAQTIGKINDLVVGNDGAIKSAVIGVGGFLGIGEKNVAIDFPSIKWSVDQNGKQWAVLSTTKEQLQNAPEFDVAALQPAAPKLADGSTAASSKTATGTVAADTMAKTPPAMNTLATVQPTAVTAKDLNNVVVYSSDNKNVGEISDVVLDKTGKVDAVVVDVGGFLGIGEKPVAIGFNGLELRKDGSNNIYAYTKLTKAQLDAAIQYDKNTYPAQRDKMRVTPTG